ncbi:hypothetical protein [Ornithobacterium rhinotracheale]|nr:hypothetical protein [Ornithobacterium rhinotracheale]MCK0202235.1 hypothetical protein [Ornithobacterium rhinotracheale]
MLDYQNNRAALSILQANTRKNIIAKYTQQYVWDCIHEKYQEILSKREL